VATGGDDGAVRVWLPDALGRLRLLHQLHTMGDAPVRCLTVYCSLLLERVRRGDFLPDAPPPSEHRSVLEALADAPVHSGAGDLLVCPVRCLPDAPAPRIGHLILVRRSYAHHLYVISVARDARRRR